MNVKQLLDSWNEIRIQYACPVCGGFECVCTVCGYCGEHEDMCLCAHNLED